MTPEKLHAMAMRIAAEIVGECHDRDEAQEAMRLIQNRIEWIYTGSTKPRLVEP